MKKEYIVSVVSRADQEDFEEGCADLMDQGYKMVGNMCVTTMSDPTGNDDFVSIYHQMFVKQLKD